MRFKKPTLLVVGPTPPPYQGVSVCTELLLDVLTKEQIEFRHLDISDRRDLENIDKMDWINLFLGLKHLAVYLFMLLISPGQAVYLPLCQTKLGFLRDAAFLVPARVLGRRRILHMHGARFRSMYDSCGPLLRCLVRFYLGGNSYVLVLGESLKNLFAGLIPEDHLWAVPNGIDGETLVAAERRVSSNENDESGCCILFFGALTAAKGLHDALHAAAQVAKQHARANFVFAGGFRYPEDRELSHKIVSENGLDGRVTFHGVTIGEGKVRLFSEADIFLFPSHDEGQPLVLLEAMAAGLPVVTTAVGATSETVLAGTNGFVVPVGDIDMMVAVLGKLVQDAELRRRMSEESRKRYRDLFTREQFANRLAEVFGTLLRKH